RKVHVEVEGRDTCEPASRVQIPRNRQGRDFLRRRDERRTQTVAILDGYAEPSHQRPRVASETLLARNQSVAVVMILDVAHLQVVRDAHVVVWADDQACPFTLEELAYGLDLLLRC